MKNYAHVGLGHACDRERKGKEGLGGWKDGEIHTGRETKTGEGVNHGSKFAGCG